MPHLNQYLNNEFVNLGPLDFTADGNKLFLFLSRNSQHIISKSFGYEIKLMLELKRDVTNTIRDNDFIKIFIIDKLKATILSEDFNICFIENKPVLKCGKLTKGFIDEIANKQHTS